MSYNGSSLRRFVLPINSAWKERQLSSGLPRTWILNLRFGQQLEQGNQNFRSICSINYIITRCHFTIRGTHGADLDFNIEHSGNRGLIDGGPRLLNFNSPWVWGRGYLILSTEARNIKNVSTVVGDRSSSYKRLAGWTVESERTTVKMDKPYDRRNGSSSHCSALSAPSGIIKIDCLDI